jgi:hypothetical protein
MVNDSKVVVVDDERVGADAGPMSPTLREERPGLSTSTGDARRADPRVPRLARFRILGLG